MSRDKNLVNNIKYLEDQEEDAYYTMTLNELVELDPTVFEFEYYPQILINDVDLKDYVKAYYGMREIGQYTPKKFKQYLRRAFLMNAEQIYQKYQMYLKMVNKDQFASSTNNGKQVAKFYATPAEGYAIGEDIETTKTTNEINNTTTNDYPIIIYRAYVDNLDNVIDDMVRMFNKLFFGLLA